MERKLRAVIIDDEINSIEALKFELQEFAAELEILECFQEPGKAVAYLLRSPPDVLFLDVEMPGMNGFELLHSLPSLDFEVIFTTAYDSYAIKAFRTSAVDYLLKPILSEDLNKAISKVRQKINSSAIDHRIEKMLENFIQSSAKLGKVLFPTLEGLEFINIDDIIYCASDKNYTMIHQKNEEKLIVSKTLKDVEDKLYHFQFLRVHHSYIVNMKYIRRYVRGSGGTIELINGKSIPVSRSKKEEFLSLFKAI